MNTVERIIHGIVRNHPGIRKNIVVAYQRAFSLFPAKPYECSHALIHHPGSFYGFHDKCPWSADGSKLLAHRFDISKSIDDLERNPVEVGFYEGENYEIYRPIESTLAWNWQQGSSLQWVGESNRVVFNGDFDGTSTATLVDLDTGNRRRLHGQVMSVSNDGKWAASCSFDRLGHGMPGYGYALTDDNVLTKELCPEQEAIAILDLENDKVMSVVALEHVLDFRNGHVEGGLYHYFSHCLFSPDSKRMVFYHRCLYKTGNLVTRVYSVNVAGGAMWRFPCEECSHISWAGAGRLLAYCKPANRPSGYYLFEEFSDSITAVGHNLLTSDGHPQVSSNGRYILLDTYPDRSRSQKLRIYDMTDHEVTELIKYRIPFKYRHERRCDFHPRWSRDESMICFDTAHTGVRSLCVIRNPVSML